jgi:hypothetical protein
MFKLISFAVSALLSVSVAFAQAPTASTSADCATKAVSKAGKPLAGAAKTSFVKKCEADAKAAMGSGSGCDAKAVSKAGKPLYGAAKASFMKKCEADAKKAK